MWEGLDDKEETEGLLPQEQASDGDGDATEGATHPSKQRQLDMSSRWLLTMFCAIYLLVWFDRGVYSAVLDSVETQFDMSDFQAGAVGGVYMIGYVVTSPVSAHLAHTHPPLHLCGWGMVMWAVATTLCAFAVDFWSLLLARMLTGVGEAAFLCLSFPLIDQYAPPESRSSWMGIFMSMNPVGFAIGATFGGMVVGSSLSRNLSWRVLFVVEAIVSLPWICALMSARGPSSIEAVDASGPKGPPKSMFHSTLSLFRNSVYRNVVGAYTAQTFAVGATATFLIKYMVRVWRVSESTAGALFGVSTLCTGVGGPLVSGWMLDRLKSGTNPSHGNTLVVAAHRILIPASVVMAPVFLLVYQTDTFPSAILMFLSELLVFMCLVPFNASLLWCLPVPLQPLGIALSTAVLHLLGDTISAPIAGALNDKYGMRTGLTISTAVAFLSLPFLFFSHRSAVAKAAAERHRPGKDNDDDNEGEGASGSRVPSAAQ